MDYLQLLPSKKLGCQLQRRLRRRGLHDQHVGDAVQLVARVHPRHGADAVRNTASHHLGYIRAHGIGRNLIKQQVKLS